MKPDNCLNDCPGCGITFAPDVAICPLTIFAGWELGRDLDIYDFMILEKRRLNTGGLNHAES